MEQIVGALAFAVRCERERVARAPPSSRNQEPVRDRDRDRPFNNKRPCNNNVNNGESKVCKSDNRLRAGNVGGWLEGGTAGR